MLASVLMVQGDLGAVGVHQLVDDTPPAHPKAVFSKNTDGVLPPGTSELRQISHVTDGKCRFTCHEEPLCSGYKWTGNDNHCVLLQAPSHLTSTSANSAWHKQAANLAGFPFEEDPVEAEMLRMAQKAAAAAKEDERKSSLGIDGNMAEAIEAVKKERRAAMKVAKSPEEMKQASLESSFTISAIKQFVEAHRQKFDSDVERVVAYKARELAKKELSRPEEINQMSKDDFKDMDGRIEALAHSMRSSVKPEVQRDATRAFVKEMNADVLFKVTNFKEDQLKAKEAKEAEQKNKIQQEQAKANQEKAAADQKVKEAAQTDKKDDAKKSPADN
jgi:hypothetical protein